MTKDGRQVLTRVDIKTLYYNGLRHFSIEEGFFFALLVGGLQQKYNSF